MDDGHPGIGVNCVMWYTLPHIKCQYICVRVCLFVHVLANRTTFPLGLVKVMIVYFFPFFILLSFAFASGVWTFFPSQIHILLNYPFNHSTIAYIYWEFSIKYPLPVYVCALAIPMLFDYCVIFSGFMYSRFIHSTRIFLILLEFNMFVIADVWNFVREWVCCSVHALVWIHFWSHQLCYSNGFFLNVKMYRHKEQHTWTVTAGMLMENLSCKVKPTQFVYRFAKLVCYESRHFSSVHFLLFFSIFFSLLDRHIWFNKADIFISPINNSIFYLFYSKRIFSHIELSKKISNIIITTRKHFDSSVDVIKMQPVALEWNFRMHLRDQRLFHVKWKWKYFPIFHWHLACGCMCISES